MTRTPTRPRCPIDVFGYRDYRVFLEDFYAAKKRQRFSYRRFSQIAGLGAPNYLKLVITGHRNLTPQMATRFAEACGLAGDAHNYFLALVRFNQAKTDQERNDCYDRLKGFRRYRRSQKLDLAHAAYHSTWYLPTIREMVSLPAFREDPEWIAAALRPEVKPVEVKQAIATLLELGLLERDSLGRLRQRSAVVSTGAEASGMYIRNYHAEMMARATAAMELVPKTERDISSLTLSVGAESLQRIKARIQEFRRELIETAEAESAREQIIQVNFQLFPLTNPTRRKKKVTR